MTSDPGSCGAWLHARQAVGQTRSNRQAPGTVYGSLLKRLAAHELQPRRPGAGHRGIVNSVAFGQRLVLTCGADDAQVCLWDLQTHKMLGAFDPGARWAVCAAQARMLGARKQGGGASVGGQQGMPPRAPQRWGLPPFTRIGNIHSPASSPVAAGLSGNVPGLRVHAQATARASPAWTSCPMPASALW